MERLSECEDVCRPRSIPIQPSSHNAPTTRSRSSRNEHRPWPRHRLLFSSVQPFSLLVLMVFACLSLSAAASPTREFFLEEEMVEPIEVRPSDGSSPLLANRLPGKSQLLVDPSPPPFNPKVWVVANQHDDRKLDQPIENIIVNLDLVKRGAESSSSSSSSSMESSSSTKTTAPKHTSTSSSTTTSGIVVATPTSNAVVTPFDQGLSNITQSCSNFFESFLTNATFNSCLPFSLLIQNSLSFFNAEKSVTLITQVLEQTCAANVTACTPLMNALAANISASENCASDLSASNPLVVEAKLGLEAYASLYTASCLHNPETFSFCFADAVTNISSPTDSYIYYLPVNLSLPAGAQPTCSTCLKNTMAVFEQATSDRSSSIAGDYAAAAQQINVQCGPGFVNQTLAVAITETNSGTTATPLPMGIILLAIAISSWFI